ncbi:MAG: hypothetical protein ACJ755_05165 [Gaiellaceae bacterium]
MKRAARASLVAALLLWPTALAEAAPVRVLVTGDSMVQPLDDLMVRPVERRGGHVITDPQPASGLTRPFVLDWPTHARRQVRAHRPHATVMFIGAGDTEPLTGRSGQRVLCCQRDWIDAYAERVERMMRTYMRHKRRDVYWLTLPLPRQKDRRPQFLAINYAIEQAARKAGGHAHVVDTVPVLSPDDEFHRRLRYRGRSVVVRDRDGVHLTRAGSRIARDLVVRAIRRDGVLRRTARAAAVSGTASLAYEKPLPELEIGAAYALSVESGQGQSNRIAVAERAEGFTVVDGGAPLRPGRGCTAVTSRRVRCPMPRAVEDRSVFVDAAGAPDSVVLSGVSADTFAEARGGAAGDLIYGSAGDDFLSGDAGIDAIVGGPGVDVLDGGAGGDILGGGPDRDGVSYQRRTGPVTVDLARGRGGGAGEHDRLIDIESVIGGMGADEIRGTNATNTLVGGEGGAHDRLVGRGGDDGLIGYRAVGGAGDDVLDTHRPTCGRGQDSIFRRTFSPLGPFAHTCERLIAIFAVLRPQAIRSSRHAAVFGVRCERAGRCRGALELRDARGRIGRKRFSLRRRGDSVALHKVPIRFARRPQRRIATLHVFGARAYQHSRFRVRLR